MLRKTNGTVQNYCERTLTSGMRVYCKVTEKSLDEEIDKTPTQNVRENSNISSTLNSMNLFGEV